MKQEPKSYQVTIGGQPLMIETGHLAGQAGGALTLRIGDTMVLATATMSTEPRTGINFFPLTVDYEERMYAGGRIPGSFFRREGRPTEKAILTARLTDRSLRPLFPKDMRNDVQVILYSISHDGENPIDVAAVNAASIALMISDVPWGGPVANVRVGRVNGEFVVNPTFQEVEESDLDLLLTVTEDALLMVEAGATEVPEDVILAALDFGQNAAQPLLDLQRRMVAEIGKEKRDDYPRFGVEEALIGDVMGRVRQPLQDLLDQPYEKIDLYGSVDRIRQEVVEEMAPEDEERARQVRDAFSEAYKQIMRARILEQNNRADGRSPDQIREIWSKVEVSPRAHGSGIFTRGETQVLTLATLGTPREAQELDNLTPRESKRYIHHYNFPPFSTGETRFLRGASRREIGHGALAERALLPMIPPETEFPYTLRLVSEVLSSNGSTSMASVCASTLALMDTGVPIKSPVAGIAMGLIKSGDRHVILTDILGVEDHLGDMDFKVAGTRQGINALQMDIKIKGISSQTLSQALSQAREARLFILDRMAETIGEPRPDLKEHAPRITVIQIPVDKIGAIIGPGGKTIRGIQEETNTRIDVEEDGTVFIASTDGTSEREARTRIEALTEEPKIGHIYTGRVVRTTHFGAFIEILPNTDGMVHISQLDTGHVNKVEDVVEVGDEATVMITDIDNQGRIRLSRQAVLEGWTPEEAMARDRGGRKSSGGKGRGRRNRN